MGERFAMPIYPAAMSTLTQPTTGPARWHRTRQVASALSFAAAALTFIGSFLPLYSTSLDISGLGVGASDPIVITATAWGVDVTGGPGPGFPNTSAVPVNGYPMVVACFMLIAAAVVSWFAASPGSSAATRRAAVTSVGIGAAFLFGTAWTVALQVMAAIDGVAELTESGIGVDLTAAYEAGHWLLLTAALLGAAATVLVLIPVRDRTWSPTPVDPNMATPPYGFALPVNGPIQAPVGHPSSVDPLTGLPIAPVPGQPGMPYPQSGPGAQPPVHLSYPSPPGGVPALTRRVDPPPVAPPGLPDGPPVDPATGMPVLGPVVIPAPSPAPGPATGPAVPPTEDPLAEPRRD
jgi:hypothetical protein